MARKDKTFRKLSDDDSRMNLTEYMERKRRKEKEMSIKQGRKNKQDAYAYFNSVE